MVPYSGWGRSARMIRVLYGRRKVWVMATRGCASLTPGYMPRLRLGLTCFACHRIHGRVNADVEMDVRGRDPGGRMPTGFSRG